MIMPDLGVRDIRTSARASEPPAGSEPEQERVLAGAVDEHEAVLAGDVAPAFVGAGFVGVAGAVGRGERGPGARVEVERVGGVAAVPADDVPRLGVVGE